MSISLGLLEWFRPGEDQRVEQVLQDLARLGVQKLRTGVSWAEYHTDAGARWYEWLLPTLARQVELLPCFLYTPPSLGIRPKVSSPPRAPHAYADWLDTVITRHGNCFEYVELWNEPNNLSEWDWTLDPHWLTFCEMIGGAAYWARQRGKKTVLGGMAPMDPQWLALMIQRGVIEFIDVVGVHAFPALWEAHWPGWTAQLQPIQDVLARHRCKAPVWISETGYSTWRHDEFMQVQAFLDAVEAPVDRVYWYAAQDLHPDHGTVDGFHTDEREYHLGLKKADGRPKLLHRAWASGGLGGVRSLYELARPRPRLSTGRRPILVTGGAGFVGSRLCEHLAQSGQPVIVYDNLSRTGSDQNLQRLKERYWSLVDIQVADLLDPYALRDAVACAEAVFHLAADPLDEAFDSQVRGTLHLLDAIRKTRIPPPLIAVSGVPADTKATPLRVSRMAVERYVQSYARTYGLPATLLRFGCLFGPGMGASRQAWRADELLHVDDAVEALLAAQTRIGLLRGRAYNIPGFAPQGTAELSRLLRDYGVLPGKAGDAKRLGNGVQKPTAFSRDTGWRPRMSLEEGLLSLSEQGHLGPRKKFIPEKGGVCARSRG